MRWLTHLSDSTLQWPHEARAQTHSFARCPIRNCSRCGNWMSSLSWPLENEYMYIYIYLEWIDTDRSESLCRMGRCLDLVYPQHADTCSWNQPKFKIFVHIICETVWDEKDKPGATKANSFCKVLTLPISISTHVFSERAPSMKCLPLYVQL